jgi:hypothetical protein
VNKGTGAVEKAIKKTVAKKTATAQKKSAKPGHEGHDHE